MVLFHTFIDYNYRFMWVYTMKSKAEVYGKSEAQCKQNIKRLRFDGGG